MNSDTSAPFSISIVIPTLNRGQLLVDTIKHLLALDVGADDIIVVDQTLEHASEVEQALAQFHKRSEIHWIKLDEASVVKAMNVGLLNASSDYVLFLDDDIKPFPGLLTEHADFVAARSCALVAGRVVQPWDDPIGTNEVTPTDASFNYLGNRTASFFIGANFLVNRLTALAIGGFDESFKGTAHDYEREFSDRVLLAGEQIWYCGSAAVLHLKEVSGGIRTHGHFLKTVKPHHAVGAYYYLLRSPRVEHRTLKIVRRLVQRITTKTHLRAPWWILPTLMSDIVALLWAIKLRLEKPRLVSSSAKETEL